MKILHLFSSHRLTGSAAQAITLAAELMKRGHEITFAHTPPPPPAETHIDHATAAGLNTTTAFELPKHLIVSTLVLDAIKLNRFIRTNGFDVVHCHLMNDHLTTACALLAGSKTKLVRTNHAAAPLKKTLRNMFLFPSRTHALIELSNAALESDVTNFKIPRERVSVIDASIDLGRFDTAFEMPDMRVKWGLRSDDFVIGIAARIQHRSGFDVLLDSVALALREIPNLKLVVIGSGSQIEKVVVLPARERGLSETVVLAGDLQGDDYIGGLAALDAAVFLAPGSDGYCRVVREAMALGRPVIAAQSGILPELIEDGVTGRVVVDTPYNLAGAIVALGRDEGLRIEMGRAARETAVTRFDPVKQVEKVEQIYQSLL